MNLNKGCVGVLRWIAWVALPVLAVACAQATPGGDDAGGVEPEEVQTVSDVQFGSPDQALQLADTAEIAALEVASRAETVAAEVAPGDGGAACSAPGCMCSGNAECDSGQCIETPAGMQCAKTCVDTCPTGYNCTQVSGSGGDVVTICTPAHPRLCEPCGADTDCSNVLGGAASRCVAYHDQAGALIGQFCATSCGKTGCPEGFACQQVTSVGGAAGTQCMRADLVCPCDGRATALKLATTCGTKSAAGSCSGKRSCGPAGLSACDAPAAASETCNLKDDNCNGQTDEPAPGVCDDGSECTYDNCVSGACQYPPKTGLCSDSSLCTNGDFCSDGFCKGLAVACDDKNPCSADSCDPKVGCVFVPASGAGCNDNNVCTSGDTCAGGLCLPGDASVCDDANPCTTDSCSKLTGCVFGPNSLGCDDGDPCTFGDSCALSACKGGKASACSDGNPCTDDGCDPKLGCTFKANQAVCSDGNDCSEGDKCQDAVCAPGPTKVCDDSNPCTNDVCDPKKGCIGPPNAASCQDGNPCTENDACKVGQCAPGSPKVCDDGNPCTKDLCDAAKGCTSLSTADACDDGNVCTENDGCKNGNCAAGKFKLCEDGNPCTTDGCDPGTGCTTTGNTLPCSDGNTCTEDDVCKASKCSPGTAKVCNDGNPCSDDKCDPQLGCGQVPNKAQCDDGNSCTVGDSCNGGKCVPLGTKGCDDSNGCTSDACDPGLGCLFIANNLPCNDGNLCTDQDACKATKCAPGTPKVCDDGNPCTDDTCDPLFGCLQNPNKIKCNDGNTCTTGDICTGGTCVNTGLVACDDKNPCTNDFCEAIAGCGAGANTLACSDGNPCTENDLCKNGLCSAGKAVTCNDGNSCTDDTCDPATGCKFSPNTANCDDGNACSTADKCAAGVCKMGTLCAANASCKVVTGALACVCDAGFAGNGFSCVSSCGDGVVSSSETCDDKNVNSGDGCSNLCAAEPGYNCTGTPSLCVTKCGDGIVKGAEQCDNGNSNSDTLANACRTTCKKAGCGDKVTDSGETCDDGNTNSGDGCSGTCQSESKTCQKGTTLSQAPSGKAVLCQNPASCEQDKGADCPVGMHLCILQEFNAYNAGWSYTASGQVIGAIGCRPSSGAGHLTMSGGPMSNQQTSNCSWGSSNPWCSASYGCNELQGLGVCCVDNPLCGNGVIEAIEACDDANKVNGDGCDNNCAKTSPPGC